MLARIYRPAKNAMQSGKAKTKDWVLEFEPASARRSDPLTPGVDFAAYPRAKTWLLGVNVTF